MHKTLLVSKYTAIKQLISSQIRRTASIYAGRRKINYIDCENIHLYKGRNANKVFYITPLALKLSKSNNIKALKLAHEIEVLLSASLGNMFLVHVTPAALIHVVLSDECIATWLTNLTSLGDEEKGEGDICSTLSDSCAPELLSSSPALFTAQYIHGRCCSLLRLAEQEKLIKLNEITCNSISWLNDHQKLRCDRQATHRLISELIQMVDWIYCDRSDKVVNWEKAVVSLIDAFEAFWSNCRIWGEVKSISPELARMRIGLILATRAVLKLFLSDKLGIIAPQSM
ncbi:MAG: DALR anticodon-binding domain-containing protein [Calothrix sp. MO_167.B42]|nr:DALR anticodon-binding domain-containing protein [Calothrix sp. MO_167.B42]